MGRLLTDSRTLATGLQIRARVAGTSGKKRLALREGTGIWLATLGIRAGLDWLPMGPDMGDQSVGKMCEAI